MKTLNTNWCSYMPEPQEFLQGFTVPGGLIMSPIEVTGRPMSVKELQNTFYSQTPLYRLRRGPKSLDEDRINFQFDYQTPPAGYPYQVSLISPALLLQSRTVRSETCAYALGTEYNANVWGTAVNVTCRAPYLCSHSMMTNPTELMACSSEERPQLHFGRKPIDVRGKNVFYEFLQTIADSELVIRSSSKRKYLDTRAFLDPQTETLSCLMVAYSAQFGICSTIEITATFASDVSVDFTVTHFQSLEGEDLVAYIQLTIGVLVLSLIIFIEKILTARFSVWGSWCGKKDQSAEEWTEIRGGFIVDVIVQVVLPVVYFSIRLAHILKSQEDIQRTIGMNGLAGVPWADRSVELRTKVDKYVHHVNELGNLNDREFMMNVFYFIMSGAQLLRLIIQASAHPRLAILVNTLVEGIDDLWHFFLLLLIILVGFNLLGTAQFGGERSEFASGLKLFETLFDMLLGSLPESGLIPSSHWTHDKLFMVFVLIYNALGSFFMLNFIIG
jgi:hypothetical protein